MPTDPMVPTMAATKVLPVCRVTCICVMSSSALIEPLNAMDAMMTQRWNGQRNSHSMPENATRQPISISFRTVLPLGPP